MIKILTILGARPQFIKAGSLSRELLNYSNIQEVIVHTGQHYDSNMSDVFFTEMKIPTPNYFLDVGGGSHGEMTGRMIEKIEKVVMIENPDWMLVYGDTNSTLAGAIVASKLHIKLAHVEAGLRSFNMKMPEEINRILTDRVSNLLFCPTNAALDNLKLEGFDNINSTIVNSGDIMLDGAIYYEGFAKKPLNFGFSDFILATIHRAENTNNIDRLISIIEGLNAIARHKTIILPVHPRTKAIMKELGLEMNFVLLDPVGYFEMIWLIKNSTMIITDSGGLQKESYFFKKPCITLRDETEWVELVSGRFNVLVGSDSATIFDAYKNFVFSNDFNGNIYGHGNASKIILDNLLSYS
ncbi:MULTISPECIES: non-hydrolyzing UDP-N-acetylglucosamine 2-epimerase [Bacteroidota]|uniref:non-hydrolyzing UDP-N-acetylglucosamine 2-epimerase n=1 Tax=Bacteroidota TaxID=976 RepID=UPI00328E9235